MRPVAKNVYPGSQLPWVIRENRFEYVPVAEFSRKLLAGGS